MSLPTPALGAHRAHGDGGARTQGSLRGTASGEWLRHEPWQGLHHEHSRRMANLPDMARRTNSKLGGWAMRKRKLTGAALMLGLTGKEEVT
jgi:hypothetical protein